MDTNIMSNKDYPNITVKMGFPDAECILEEVIKEKRDLCLRLCQDYPLNKSVEPEEVAKDCFQDACIYVLKVVRKRDRFWTNSHLSGVLVSTVKLFAINREYRSRKNNCEISDEIIKRYPTDSPPEPLHFKKLNFLSNAMSNLSPDKKGLLASFISGDNSGGAMANVDRMRSLSRKDQLLEVIKEIRSGITDPELQEIIAENSTRLIKHRFSSLDNLTLREAFTYAFKKLPSDLGKHAMVGYEVAINKLVRTADGMGFSARLGEWKKETFLPILQMIKNDLSFQHTMRKLNKLFDILVSNDIVPSNNLRQAYKYTLGSDTDQLSKKEKIYAIQKWIKAGLSQEEIYRNTASLYTAKNSKIRTVIREAYNLMMDTPYVKLTGLCVGVEKAERFDLIKSWIKEMGYSLEAKVKIRDMIASTCKVSVPTAYEYLGQIEKEMNLGPSRPAEIAAHRSKIVAEWLLECTEKFLVRNKIMKEWGTSDNTAYGYIKKAEQLNAEKLSKQKIA